jgi:hypothetical protein
MKATDFYNHDHRLLLEKLLYLELSGIPNGFLKCFWIRWRFQKRNGRRYETVSEAKRLQIYNGHILTAICDGYVTAVAAGQSQRLYSGVGIFNWHYLSSPPQILRFSRFDLE